MEKGGIERKFYYDGRVIVNKNTHSFHATTHPVKTQLTSSNLRMPCLR